VGASPEPHAVGSFPLIVGRRAIEGSLIGGIAETQEMLDFCAKKKVLADVEVIAAKDINAAYERMLKSDVRYRFSIDAKTL
ncbi:MAG: NAD(P)-dependent alcohol dehydrogenase, partial [Elusimicrobia bacterium]|nr:NAD(P)-dependent alcohol dehydrogenase [Elusimicrobiota bacterium]